MATYTESVAHTLGLTDEFRRRVAGETVSHTLSLTDTPQPVDSIIQSLSLSDAHTDLQRRPVAHTLTLTDSNTALQQLINSESETLALVDFAVCRTKQGGVVVAIIGTDTLPALTGGSDVGDVLEY